METDDNQSFTTDANEISTTNNHQHKQQSIEYLEDKQDKQHSTVQIHIDQQHKQSTQLDQSLNSINRDVRDVQDGRDVQDALDVQDAQNIESYTTLQSNQPDPYTILELNRNPVCLTKYTLNGKDNFFKGCKWSPDGSCLLTASNDKTLRLFNLPSCFNSIPIDFDSATDLQLKVDLQIKECGLIYDYCFNPKLNSADASTCFLITTSHGSPIHLFDAYHGKRLHNYVAYTNTEEETFAYSLAINPITNKIYAGYKNVIRLFDLNTPGRTSDILETYYQKEGQNGLISCLAINPSNTDIFAAGSYTKQLGLYSERDLKQICVILGSGGGLTSLKFSHDGTRLFSGSRKDNEIICWDIRYLSNVLYSLKRESNTNQRINFDTNYHTDHLISGNLDGCISFYDLNCVQTDAVRQEPTFQIKGHLDCVNGISLHPFYPLLASSSGERKFEDLNDSDTDRLFNNNQLVDNSLKLWFLNDTKKYNDLFKSN